MVTGSGKLSPAAIKARQHPRKTRADLEREANEICPDASPKVNFTAALKEQKAR